MADNTVAPSVGIKQSMDKKFAGCKIELTPHLPHVPGNRGDMRKIHVTPQFFEASGRHGYFFEKTKNSFLDKVNGSMGAKFQVCIVVSVVRSRDPNK